MDQYEMICLEELVPETHNYRQFVNICSFKFVMKRLKKLEKQGPHQGYGLFRLF